MGRNSLFFFILLCLILLQDSKGSSVGDETDQSCQVSHQLEEKCGPYAHKIIKPMMAYFDQVTQQIDKNNAEMERKNNEISKLEKERANSFKDQSIKFLEDLSMLLQQQIDFLSRRNMELEQLTDKQTKEIAAIKDKVIAYEIQIKSQQQTIYEKQAENNHLINQCAHPSQRWMIRPKAA